MIKNGFSAVVRTVLSAIALTLVVTGSLEGQLAHASASHLALAGNNTATVRGFGAISVNPAGIGMPGSGFSLTVAPVQARVGLSPVKWGDIVEFDGTVIPVSTKEEWLQRVVDAGGERGRIGADATAFALTVGNIGFQLSTTAAADVNVPVGAAEALLFGNAGRTGTPVDLELAGAAVESYAMSTAAMSFALPINEMVVVGMTGKYTFGHALAVGRADSGVLSADPIQGTLDFPLVATCMDDQEVLCTQDFVEGGSGFSLDLGAMVDLGTLTVGGSIQNIISSFAWDETKLGYWPGTVTLQSGEFETDYDERSLDEAPADLRAMVDDFTLKPSIRLGAAMDVSPNLTVSGDIHGRLADAGIALQPDYSTGVGAELRLGFVQLRAGLTKISDGMQYGGGASLVLGPVNLSGAGGFVKGDAADMAMMQFGLSFGHR